MVLYCWVCKKYNCSNQNLSFHRFPADAHEKTVWFEKLGLKEFTESVSKYARICSIHFEEETFEIKPSGNFFLKKGACPFYFNEDYIPTTETASTSRLDSTKRESSTDSTDTAPGTDCSEIVDYFDPPLKRFHKDTSATLTASEIDTNPNREHVNFTESHSETLIASETELIHLLITEKETDRPDPPFPKRKKLLLTYLPAIFHLARPEEISEESEVHSAGLTSTLSLPGLIYSATTNLSSIINLLHICAKISSAILKF